MKDKIRIAILGGGPSGLFMFKRLVDSNRTDFAIDVFEKNKQLGAGMPYSTDGANDEHVTNVSGNEIPELEIPIAEWIKTVSKETLERFHIDAKDFNDYKVLPRLLFGQYLAAQFNMLVQRAKGEGILNKIHYSSEVTDIIDYPSQHIVMVEVGGAQLFEYDLVVICTGHKWPKKYEGKVPGYFESPYPPAKLAFKIDYPVAIKGSSLTAIDAIRTLSRHNGVFSRDSKEQLVYAPTAGSENFKLIMHTRSGLLPAIRFHLEDSHLSKNSLLSPADIAEHRAENEGFLSLDYIFEKDFKVAFRDKRPAFYEQIKDLTMEGFVGMMMDFRETIEPFDLFRAEYIEAEKSIKRKESVYWKEMLAILSFAMNYPAKYLSAEDMQRLQKVLMPLISIVIAFVPQSSCEELLALHRAGILSIIHVGEDSYTEPGTDGGVVYHYQGTDGLTQAVHFKTFVDCVGQPHLSYEEFPYKSLVSKQTISPAKLNYKDAAAGKSALADNKLVEADNKGNYYLRVPGITINDNFQPVDAYGAFNERIYVMAVPYIGGYNPDYSGLDFSEAASAQIIESILTINGLISEPTTSEA